ncbi:PKD domain-containing protein [Corallococcus sp. AB011P]|uniref:PKD domain-containing protein n=1 Tax=Corallococcus sp. AB011P TaxID=2316735 RepID=UPI0011C465FB|nr:PKD domain-containing protein [Corallococcus sp. AB011P]
MRRLSVPRWMPSWLGCGLAFALGLTGCGPAESPEDFRLAEAEAAVTFEPASGVLFGAFAGKRGTEDHAAALDALEQVAERKMDVHRIYAVWDEAQPNKFLLADLERGRIPLLSITAKRQDGSGVSWASIASGAQDAQLKAHALALKGTGKPLFLIFNHEPDMAGTAHGSPAEFATAFRRLVTVFRQQCVTNVSYSMTLVPYSFQSGAADAFWPGSTYVDWVGADAYNWNGCNPTAGDTWRSLEEAVAPVLAWAHVKGKPVMLPEWGSVEDASTAGRKGQWFRDALDTFKRHPEIKVASYFHTTGTCPWWVDSSASSVDGFHALGASGYTHATAAAWLQPSTTTGTAPLTVTFDLSGSTGFQSTTGTGNDAWGLDFGDGSAQVTGRGRPTALQTHRYTAKGTYRASLTVTDWKGVKNTDTRVLTVK